MNFENKNILVVLPTYNNIGYLPALLSEVEKYAEHILVVNDGSTDGTAQLLNSLSESKTKSISHAVNQGKGAALLTAFNYARERDFDFIITMDTDGQHLPADILNFKKAINNCKIPTLFIGDRELDKSTNPHIPGSSKFGRRFSDFWVWIETGKKLSDTQSGFRAYPVREIPLETLSTSRYDFEIEILVRTAWNEVPIVSIPIQIYYPPREERLSHFAPFKDNFRLSLLHTKLVTLRILNALFSKNDSIASREKPGSFLLRYCLKLGGLRFCYFFSPLVVFFYFIFSGHARRGIEALYLHLGIQKKRKRLYLSFKNFQFFALSMIDRMALSYKLKDIKVQWDSAPLDFSGEEGAILLGSHFGDWIFCGMKLRERLARPLHIVMDRRFSKKFQSQMGDESLKGLNIIDITKGGLEVLLEIKEALDCGAMVCFLGDRSQYGRALVPARAIPFLGEEAFFPLSHFELALKLKRPIYAFVSIKVTAGVDEPYRCSAVKLWDAKTPSNAGDLLKSYGEFLESMLRRAPYNWFNFFDFWEMGKRR